MRFVNKTVCATSRGIDGLPKCIYYWYIILIINLFALVLFVLMFYYRLNNETLNILKSGENNKTTHILDKKLLNKVLVKYQKK